MSADQLAHPQSLLTRSEINGAILSEAPLSSMNKESIAKAADQVIEWLKMDENKEQPVNIGIMVVGSLKVFATHADIGNHKVWSGTVNDWVSE